MFWRTETVCLIFANYFIRHKEVYHFSTAKDLSECLSNIKLAKEIVGVPKILRKVSSLEVQNHLPN